MRPAIRLLPVPLLVAASLSAQSNAERMANDRYTRSHDYDLLHQRIEVRDFDWDSLTFNGRVTTTLRALRPSLDSVILDAGKGLEVQSVLTDSGARPKGKVTTKTPTPLLFAHTGDTLVVRLARPLGFGDTTSFTVAYRARIKDGEGLTFIEADTGAPARPRQLWSQGEDDNNHYWFPTYDFPNDKLTWELVATVPAGFTVVSNGRLLLDRRNRDGSRTMHWSQERPAVSYLISLVVAPLVRIADRWRGKPVEYYVYRQDSALARRLFGVTPDMISVYSRLTGIPYPWARYAQTTVADFFGGMENVSATTLVDWLPDTRAYVDRPWYQHILIPHELAHQWFGDLVTTANWANFWLNEGFAEFLPGQYWATRQGRQAGEDYYLDEYQQFMGIDQRRRMPLASLGSNNIYPKGALVLEMLRKYLGDERFWAGIHLYLTRHAYGVATSDDLRQAFLQATGENLAWFWDQWVYQAGFPEFRVAAVWDSAQAKVTVTIRQEQRDTLPADSTGFRYTVPEVFRMPMTIRVGTLSGGVSQRVDLTGREQVVRIAGVTTAPTMVIFDDGNRVLKRLEFGQPTTWLASQLAQDADLWNRSWVINQLAQRRNDSEALAALLRAATASDYFLTRAQAVAALGGFQGPGVPAALLVALQDSSAQVRAAAVEALGGFPAAEVNEAVEAAWERDTSYAVRAAALGALVRLRPGGARTLLRRGLATPSYQNAIADAALLGIIQTADSTLLPDVWAALQALPDAGHVLAAFAARGSDVALHMLEESVYSPRAAVRQRALQAFQLSLPSTLARPRLISLRAEAPSDRVREEIDEALTRLKP
jgi:aminopeptidase N